jgi:hypothetical protein
LRPNSPIASATRSALTSCSNTNPARVRATTPTSALIHLSDLLAMRRQYR